MLLTNSFLAEHFGHSLPLFLSVHLLLSSLDFRLLISVAVLPDSPFCDNTAKQENRKSWWRDKRREKARGKKKRTGEKWLRGIKAGQVGKLQFDTVMLEIQGGNIERSGSFVEDRTIRGERRWRDESVVSLKFAPPSLLRACRRSRDPGPLSKFQRTLSARGGIRDEQSVYALYIYIPTIPPCVL